MAWCFQLKYLITTREGWLFIIAWRLYWMIHGLLPQHKIPSCLPEAPWFGDGLSTLGGFLNQICVALVVIPLLGGQVQGAVFFSCADEEYSKIQHHFHLLLPFHSFSFHETQWGTSQHSSEYSFGLWGGRGRAEAVPIPLSVPKISPQPWFCEVQPSTAPLNPNIQHTHRPRYFGSHCTPFTPPGCFSDAKIRPQKGSFLLLKCIFSLCKSTQGWFKRGVTSD